MKKNKERTFVPEEVPEYSNNNYLALLKCIDILMSSIIIAPCVIAYWRGTWQIIELLLIPQNESTSALISFALGSFGHMFFTLCQDTFKKSFDPDKKRLTYYIGSRCYTAVFGVVCVNMWRGVWNLCDYLTSKTSLGIILLTTVLALTVLVVIKTTRSLSAAPFVVSSDSKQIYFEISTIFNTQRFHRPALYFLDTFISAIVVGTLVVIAWRGVWKTLDLTLYRSNELISAILSLVIGYGIVVLTFALQPILRRICRDVNGTLKLILADSYYLISFIGAVNVWRGIWILLDIYLYPENEMKSYVVSHAISFLILTVLNCSNSILVRGIVIDGEEEVDKSCVEFPIAYIKLHLHKKRVRKYLEQSRKNENNQIRELESLTHK